MHAPACTGRANDAINLTTAKILEMYVAQMYDEFSLLRKFDSEKLMIDSVVSTDEWYMQVNQALLNDELSGGISSSSDANPAQISGVHTFSKPLMTSTCLAQLPHTLRPVKVQCKA